MGKRITERYRDALAAKPTYPQIGATRDAELPLGYGTLHRRILIGSGHADFHAAGAAVRRWGPQRGAGLAVYPPGVDTEPGATAIITLHLPRLAFPRVLIPCRVIWAVDEPDRAGFAYGTLPGHPECGEESFTVELDNAGDVWFDVRAFSRPAAWYARAGGPLTRAAQLLATRRYLRAMAAVTKSA